jgi:hypothetical protein
VAAFCEHGNEPSGSKKCGKFFDCPSDLVPEEGLCRMELNKN